MNQIERRDKGMAYVCDDEAFAQQAECRKIFSSSILWNVPILTELKKLSKSCSASRLIRL